MEEKIYLGLHHIHLRGYERTSKKTNELYFVTEAVYTGIMICSNLGAYAMQPKGCVRTLLAETRI